jgi:hypothetical protein
MSYSCSEWPKLCSDGLIDIGNGLCSHCLHPTEGLLPVVHDPYDPRFDMFRCGSCGCRLLRYEVVKDSTFNRFCRWVRGLSNPMYRMHDLENQDAPREVK